MTTLKIKVTKDVLEKSKNCVTVNSIETELKGVGANCAIALAVRDIFPYAWIEDECIDVFCFKSHFTNLTIDLPNSAIRFIKKFDKTEPDQRPLLPELEFEVEIPDIIVDMINIDELKPLLENHPTLELINSCSNSPIGELVKDQTKSAPC